MVLKSVGLVDVLREKLVPLSGKIAVAFVYGSMASGEAGPQSDVDLMVVGDVDDLKLHRAISEAEEVLGRAVNYTLMSADEFKERGAEGEGFIRRLLSGQHLAILGDADEVR